jgi:hypothetical protein
MPESCSVSIRRNIDVKSNRIQLTTSRRQRAFRERKESHLRDLKEKMSSLENQVSVLQAENKALRTQIPSSSSCLPRSGADGASVAEQDNSVHGKHDSGPTIVGALDELTTKPSGRQDKAISSPIQSFHRAGDDVDSQENCTISLESLWTLINTNPLRTAGEVNLIHLISLLEWLVTFEQPARISPKTETKGTAVSGSGSRSQHQVR